MLKFMSIVHAAALAFASPFITASVAQTPTTFTYQGSLSSSGSPLTGQADLRVTLFSAATDGSPIGNPIDLPSITITNGLFTVPLDFGNAFDQGQPRWLEISVRAPAGSGSFTTLAPRQSITPTPLAQGLAGIALARTGPRTLDQAQDQLGPENLLVGANAPVWQSWTASVSGRLSQIEVIATGPFGDTPPLSVTVREGVGLSGAILGSTSVNINFAPSATPVPIFLPNIPIQAGRAYTLEFTANLVNLRSAAVSIPGATGFRNAGPFSWWFRTYVTPSASIDARASTAAFASFAGTAIFAQTASSVPWSALTGQPAITTSAVGTNWQLLFQNPSIANFRGGARLSDSGFLELTNTANLASPNFARLNSAGAWTAVSDQRLKTDITEAQGNLASALQLRPVHFRWKDSGTQDFGLIAQEVRTVLPSLVSGDESEDTLTLNYSQLSVVAIGAIQELKAQHERELRTLKAELVATRHESADLRARLSRLEKLLDTPTSTPTITPPQHTPAN